MSPTLALAFAGSMLVLPSVSADAAAAPTCAGVPATIVGTDGDDYRMGTAGRDVVWLGPGDDTFHDYEGGGNDLVCGGAGDDSLYGGSGDDVLRGEDGNDFLTGDAGDDRLLGAADSDSLFYDGIGADVLNGGGAPDNTLTLASASGGGWASGEGARLDLAERSLSVGDVESTVIGFDAVYGSSAPDVLLGTDADEWFQVGDGDTLGARGGDDYVNASGAVVRMGSGDDTVRMYAGKALLGSGEDTVYAEGRVHVEGGGGSDDLGTSGALRGSFAGGGGRDFFGLPDREHGEVDLGRGRSSWDGGSLRLQSVESIQGSSYRDILTGSDKDDVLMGDGEADVLRGRGGDDMLYGGGGRDVAVGGAGDDLCFETRVRKGCERTS